MIGSVSFRGHSDSMLRTLPPISMPSLEDRAPSPLPPMGHDISRPSSTSTQSSNALRQQQHFAHQHHHQSANNNTNNHNNNGAVNLPGMSALASVASAQSPQLRSFSSVNHGLNYSNASPTPTSVGGQGNSPPICQNCQTSTTPLWRRDEIGSVLCNACGLFLKLHGRPRPISLKTDVIKSRNRVKSSGQALKKAAKALMNGSSRSEAGTPPPGPRRVSQKSAGDSDRSNSPVSRTTTPTVLAPPHTFDHAHQYAEHHLSHSPSLPALHFRQPSPATSLGDRHLELPHTYEGLQQANTALKTRVSELEVINGLFKGRVQELERAESMQRHALEQSQMREEDLQRRLEVLERQFAEIHRRDSPCSAGSKRRLDIEADLSHPQDESPPYAKRTRLPDMARYPEPPQSIAT